MNHNECFLLKDVTELFVIWEDVLPLLPSISYNTNISIKLICKISDQTRPFRNSRVPQICFQEYHNSRVPQICFWIAYISQLFSPT